MSRAIVYLHGFRSSPASIKATQLRFAIEALPERARPTLFVPQLSHWPNEAVATVESLIARVGDATRVTFVGSSLGGYYATHLAERFGARAVLVNPAVRPYDDLRPYVGAQTNLYTGEAFTVTDQHFVQLRSLAVSKITRADRYFLLVETGDELLDYREAVAFYAGAYQYVQGGGDHGFASFGSQLPAILRFAGIDSD